MSEPSAIWLEGQRQEKAGVRAFRPAFMRGVVKVSAFYASLLQSLSISPAFPILQQLERAPWGQMVREIDAAWFEISHEVIDRAARELLDTVQKVSARDIEAFSRLWAAENSLLLAQNVTRTSREAMQFIIQEASVDLLTPGETVELMRDQVGLNKVQTRALARQRRLMVKQGIADRTIKRTLKKRSDEMRKERTETIARTEVNAARNFGTLRAMQQARAEGELPVTQKKKWVTFGPCKICAAIKKAGPVPINKPFISPLQGNRALAAPPAHPRCRCSVALA